MKSMKLSTDTHLVRDDAARAASHGLTRRRAETSSPRRPRPTQLKRGWLPKWCTGFNRLSSIHKFIGGSGQKRF